MENVIRDHLSNYGVLITIFPLGLKINISGGYILTISSYNTSGKKSWGYEKTIDGLFHMEKIYNSSGELKTVYSLNAGDVSIWAENYDINWNKTGELNEEMVNDRMINYYNRNMDISIKGFTFIYNLKEHLEMGIKTITSFHSELIGYEDYLEEIAKGNLNLIESDSEVFFYIDDDKVNIVSNFSSSRRDKFVEMIKNNPAKIIEEAEKLRKNPRNYIPRLS